jgi:hypothetical protein
MDHPWTASIESLNGRQRRRPLQALRNGGGGGIRTRRGRTGGAVKATNGSQPLDRVNGRRFSRPLTSYK